jgi:hypothetical protein
MLHARRAFDYISFVNDSACRVDKRTAVQKYMPFTKQKVIISGHGSPGAFMGMTAKSLYDALVSKGLNSDRFDSICLLGCNIGLASQDNSIQQTFSKISESS